MKNNLNKRLLAWCPQPRTHVPTSTSRMAHQLRRSKLLYVIPATVIIIAIFSFAVFSAAEMAKTVRGFELAYKYGVGAKNELNTFNGTFTHDMVVDPSITTDLELTIWEKGQILQKIKEIDFFNLPSSYPEEPGRWMSTKVDYYIRVQYGSQVKEISWNNNSQEDSNVQSLEQLADLIQGMIIAKAEFKALPTPRGGYV